MDKYKITVLAGGISTERDVSLNTGKRVYEALRKCGHKAVLVDVYTGIPGEEITESIFEDGRDWAADINAVADISPDIEAIRSRKREGADGYFGPGVLELCRLSDTVFLGLHGEDGENGKVQAAFDLLGISYTGSDYMASALAMDKGVTKDLISSMGIRTPQRLGMRDGEFCMDELTYPCVIKVCHGGSSVGVYICNDRSDAERAVKEAKSFNDEILAEEFVKGREFTVSLLRGRALPVIEIAPVSGFYDYRNKYQPGATIETCPALISDEETRQMQTAAEAVYRILKMRDYARVDFMMDEEGRAYVLEANSLPGMTATSLVPQAAKAEGMEFEELCCTLVGYAMERKEKLSS